jgi:hypothetical protein
LKFLHVLMPGWLSFGALPKVTDHTIRLPDNPSRAARQCVPAQRIRGQLEFPYALTGIDFGGMDVAFGIDRQGVYPAKLPGVALS